VNVDAAAPAYLDTPQEDAAIGHNERNVRAVRDEQLLRLVSFNPAGW